MTGSHQYDARTLKDAMSDRSRWADIEVEALPDEEWGEEGGRQGDDATLAGRRQLGPRGGRRPKFPAEAVMSKAAEAKPVPVPVPAPVKQAYRAPVPPAATSRDWQEPVKPAASSPSAGTARSGYGQESWSGSAGYWGETWIGHGGYGASEDWPPSRADVSSSWRRGADEAAVPSNQSAYNGDHWGCRYSRRNWGQSRGDHRGGKSGQWH